MPDDLKQQSTHQNLMGIHWPRQKESSIVWSVELVTKDVDRRNPLDVVFCAEVGGQKATKLHQRVMTLQEDKKNTSATK